MYIWRGSPHNRMDVCAFLSALGQSISAPPPSMSQPNRIVPSIPPMLFWSGSQGQELVPWRASKTRTRMIFDLHLTASLIICNHDVPYPPVVHLARVTDSALVPSSSTYRLVPGRCCPSARRRVDVSFSQHMRVPSPTTGNAGETDELRESPW